MARKGMIPAYNRGGNEVKHYVIALTNITFASPSSRCLNHATQ